MYTENEDNRRVKKFVCIENNSFALKKNGVIIYYVLGGLIINIK